MKKIIAIVSTIIVFLVAITSIIIFFVLNNSSFLTSFKIVDVDNTGTDFYVYFDDVKAAVSYDVIVYNSGNEIVYRKNIEKNYITINFDKLNYNETYEIVVIAIDKDGNKKTVKEPYTFLWDDLSFSENNFVLMDNDTDYIIEFIGNYKDKDYKINIKKDNDVIDSSFIVNEQYVVDNKLFKDKSGVYNLEIIDDGLVVSSMNVYNLVSPITDIVIINPGSGDMTDYDDVALKFEGGKNASNYFFELYKENKLIRKKEIKSNSMILSKNLFEASGTYKAKIIASYYDYIDYSKTAEVDFTINPKETLKPVYTNYHYGLIKKGTKVSLLSPDEDSKIYYTTDGRDPIEFGKEYTEEILINDNMTIKAYAKSDTKNDSIVSTFDYKVGYKSKYKVYLSPSNQNANIGVGEVGYSNEEAEMNDLTNYIEKRLKSYNVEVYRNGPGGINRWTQDSTYLGVDLHLAIHSNASEDHTAYGIETWVDEPTSKSYSLAQNIQKSLMDIYYDKEDKVANRGVKYAYGSLGEVNANYVPFGILLEVAHHDYKEDAEWIMKNKELIGNTIADSVVEYFQTK